MGWPCPLLHLLKYQRCSRPKFLLLRSSLIFSTWGVNPPLFLNSIRPLLLLFPDRDGGVTGTTKIGREAKLLGNFFFVGRIVDVAMLLGICYMS